MENNKRLMCDTSLDERRKINEHKASWMSDSSHDVAVGIQKLLTIAMGAVKSFES
jgi:hypothetical protein